MTSYVEYLPRREYFAIGNLGPRFFRKFLFIHSNVKEKKALSYVTYLFFDRLAPALGRDVPRLVLNGQLTARHDVPVQVYQEGD